MIEIIGYIATFITGVSLMMENLKTLRLLNALGCLVWILYGLVLNSMPIVVTNVGILGIHFSKFLKEKYIKQDKLNKNDK